MTSKNRVKDCFFSIEGGKLGIYMNKMNTWEQQFSKILATPDLIAPLKLE